MQQNSSFSTQQKNLQLAFDSTSLGAFITCPRLYQYTIIEGWAPREQSAHLTFGLHYHAALERYDHAKFSGAEHREAVNTAISHALEVTWNGAVGRPWTSDHPNKNRYTLIRTIAWYLEQFENDPLTTIRLANGKPAVELSFKFETSYSAPEGTPFIYCGHLDRLATLNDETFVVDRKTTSSTINQNFFSKFNPDNQFSGYAFGSKVVWSVPTRGIIVDGAQVAVTFSRFQRSLIPIADSQLEEWYKDLGFYLNLAVSYACADYYPMNRKSCGNYGGCDFRSICAKPPGVREKWLQAGFTKRVWDPLKTRGDI